MSRLTDLGFLFRVVAVVEGMYGLFGLFVPPGILLSATGWVLTADGQWLARLLAIALASQAWVAWTCRKNPPLGVARALTLYQLGSATVDWVIWLALADEGVFSAGLARFWTAAIIPMHYMIGILLLRAIRRAQTGSSE